jgi:hypothetical protein
MKRTTTALHGQDSDDSAGAANDEYMRRTSPECGPPSAHPAREGERRSVGPLSEVVPLVCNRLEPLNNLGRGVNRDCRPRPRVRRCETVVQRVLEKKPPVSEESGAASVREPCRRRRPSSMPT